MKTVLFVCVHNAGRSQIAEAFFNKMAAERGLPVRAKSAGTVPGTAINPKAAEAMAELGIPMVDQTPKLLTSEMAREASRVISMGCGVDASCPTLLGPLEDWQLEDPAQMDKDGVRKVRDEIRKRVKGLLKEMESAA